MSYTPEDAARDAFLDELEKEFYPQHKEQAIEEFTTDQLRSFYVKNPDVAVNAVQTYKEARSLLDDGHPSASFVFAVSAIEKFLKIALLKPVVYGSIHHEPSADLIVDLAIGQSGFDRFSKLLTKMFDCLAGIDIVNVTRSGSTKRLLQEVAEVQNLRNKIMHQGALVQAFEAHDALDVATAVFDMIIVQMLTALGLQIGMGGAITPIP